MTHAQAFFHREWGCWTVGYYDPTRGGTALSYTPCRDESEARRLASEHNARETGGES